MAKREDGLNLAYAGGLFDGEGSIFLGKVKTGRNKSGIAFRLNIEMCNTSEVAVRWMQVYFGGVVYGRYSEDETRRTLWSWQIRSRKAMDFLRIILPYLRIKQPQARLAIEFQERQLMGRYTRTHTNVMDEANYILMSKMNRGKV